MRCSAGGCSSAPNELTRRESSGHLRAFVAQLTHPLALLLWAAGALALVAGMAVLAVAIVVVIVLNAAFAFAQELQAEHATEALAQLLPPQARVRRGGRVVEVPAAELVPGDVLLLEEGDRLSADARLVAGEVRDPGNRPVAHLRALGAGRSRSR